MSNEPKKKNKLQWLKWKNEIFVSEQNVIKLLSTTLRLSTIRNLVLYGTKTMHSLNHIKRERYNNYIVESFQYLAYIFVVCEKILDIAAFMSQHSIGAFVN